LPFFRGPFAPENHAWRRDRPKRGVSLGNWWRMASFQKVKPSTFRKK
jgi:hypothetical protein